MGALRRAMALTLCAIVMLLAGALPGRADDAKTAAGEIVYLLDFVRKSPCTFIRNGDEYAGPAAAAHVREKYDYYKADIHSADDFIDRAATKSALSGRPYQVRCAGAPAEPAAAWLRRALAAYRAESGANSAGGN